MRCFLVRGGCEFVCSVACPPGERTNLRSRSKKTCEKSNRPRIESTHCVMKSETNHQLRVFHTREFWDKGLRHEDTGKQTDQRKNQKESYWL